VAGGDTGPAVTRDHVELVRQIVDATNRRDADAFVAALDPDVEWEDDLFGTGGARTYRGAAGVREWLAQVWEPWESLHMEAVEITPAGDDLLLIGFELTASGRESGVETNARFWTVSRLADGKVRTRKTFLDRAEARRVAGLSAQS
jgi:ketosteroid isomerase-like protein